MFGIAHYGTFVVSFILLLILPGPGNFALITSTGKGGVKGGLAAISGVIIGDQILMWLAWQALRHSSRPIPQSSIVCRS